jgi:hypothetical protein
MGSPQPSALPQNPLKEGWDMVKLGTDTYRYGGGMSRTKESARAVRLHSKTPDDPQREPVIKMMTLHLVGSVSHKRWRYAKKTSKGGFFKAAKGKNA